MTEKKGNSIIYCKAIKNTIIIILCLIKRNNYTDSCAALHMVNLINYTLIVNLDELSENTTKGTM